MSNNIKIGKIYYYNNRPVTVLQKTSDNMYLVTSKIWVDAVNLQGQDYCEACNVGDSRLATHSCEDKQYIIDDLLDELEQEEEVFWVHKRLLENEFFERRANENLLLENRRLEKENENIKNSIKSDKEIKESYLSKIRKIMKIKDDLEKEKDFLRKEIEDINQQKLEESKKLKNIEIISDMGVSIKISPKKYKKLLKNNLILQALIDGGVDNWEWYDESLHPSDQENIDYEEQANEIIKFEFQSELENDK